MKTFFLTFFLIGCVLISPLFLISYSFYTAPISSMSIKQELDKAMLYDAAVVELNTKLDDLLSGASADDPWVLLSPFVRQEITASYVQNKAELLIDDTAKWIGSRGPSPVLSFSDLKQKLLKNNKVSMDQLESAISEVSTAMEKAQPSEESAEGSSDAGSLPIFDASAVQSFIQSDFTIPIGTSLAGLQHSYTLAYYGSVLFGVMIGIHLFLIFLVASGFQSKLRWIGATLLCMSLWNIPGAIFGGGFAFVIASTLVKNIHGIALSIIGPFVQTLVTPLLLSYTRTTAGVVIAFGILSIGMIILSFFLAPSDSIVAVASPQTSKKIKK